MQKLTYILITLTLLSLAGLAFAQDLSKTADKKEPEKKTVTSAALNKEEIAEGKGIIEDAQKLAARREAAVKVFTDTLKNTSEARLFAAEL